MAWQNHVDFVLQLAILSGALYGFYTFRRSQRNHSRTFLGVTVVNMAAIAFLMIPRLLMHIPEMSLSDLDTHATIIISHSSIGTVAAAVSVLLIVTWGLADFKLGRCKRQDLMALSFIAWMIAAGIGIFGYLGHTFEWI